MKRLMIKTRRIFSRRKHVSLTHGSNSSTRRISLDKSVRPMRKERDREKSKKQSKKHYRMRSSRKN